MRDFGTKVVAGVTPGKAGSKIEGVPVFDRVRDAVLKRKANASILFVPAPYVKDAAVEAIEAGIKLVVIITERIPFHDCLDFVPFARSKGVTLIGPNCPGIASPGQAKMGIIPNLILKEGNEARRCIRRRTNRATRKTDGSCGRDYPSGKGDRGIKGPRVRRSGCPGRTVPRGCPEAARFHMTRESLTSASRRRRNPTASFGIELDETILTTHVGHDPSVRKRTSARPDPQVVGR